MVIPKEIVSHTWTEDGGGTVDMKLSIPDAGNEHVALSGDITLRKGDVNQTIVMSGAAMYIDGVPNLQEVASTGHRWITAFNNAEESFEPHERSLKNISSKLFSSFLNVLFQEQNATNNPTGQTTRLNLAPAAIIYMLRKGYGEPIIAYHLIDGNNLVNVAIQGFMDAEGISKPIGYSKQKLRKERYMTVLNEPGYAYLDLSKYSSYEQYRDVSFYRFAQGVASDTEQEQYPNDLEKNEYLNRVLSSSPRLIGIPTVYSTLGIWAASEARIHRRAADIMVAALNKENTEADTKAGFFATFRINKNKNSRFK